jgi:thiamine-monophosphate kinase
MRETRAINELRERAGKAGKSLVLGIGDDCAVFERDSKRFSLWCQDMIVEDTHFRRGDGYKNIGRKSVAVNISDIAAMGGVPEYISVSIGLPENASVAVFRKIYDGILEICGEYGIALAGGDTVRSGKMVIDVSMTGTVFKRQLMRRSGAKSGDLVFVTGPVRNGKTEHLSFRPRFDESRFLAENYTPSAMIDTSDGIAPDIRRLCEESGTGCRLYEQAIPLSSGLDAVEALYYGESFELLFTMSRRKAERLFTDKRLRAGCPFFIIGEMTGEKKGLKLIRAAGRVENLKAEGYRHFG